MAKKKIEEKIEMKDKTPIALLSTDYHLTEQNFDKVYQLFEEKVSLAKQLGVKTLINLGDTFHSRKAQPLWALVAFRKMINLVEDNGMHLIMIPGNHDKPDYSEVESFLDPFVNISPNVSIYVQPSVRSLGGKNCWFLPFFSDEKYLNYLNEIDEDSYLFTHTGCDGYIDPKNKTKMQDKLKVSDFSKFKKVFTGHYHNRTTVKNLEFIGSLQPDSFGEDNEKGVTILYEDFSTELYKLNFRKYESLEIDVDNLSKKDFQKQVSEISQDNANIRLILTGQQENLEKLDSIELQKKGFSVKKEAKEINVQISRASDGEIIDFTPQSIQKEFEIFCQETGIEETGIELGKELLILHFEK